ncbi:MAG: Uncharacterized protein JWP80_981 [Pseudomonas sp.]|nr:Uncharacterized protein [Pseudomonas sp.]
MPTPYETSQGANFRQPPPPLQEDAQALLDSAKEQGAATLEHYRETAAEQIQTLAQSAKSAADSMQDNDTLGLSHYVTDVAQSMTSLADQLRHKSADELLRQAGQLARDNPGLFITGSIALGFGLSRFLRASSPDIAGNAQVQETGDGAEKPSRPEYDPRTAADEDLVVTPAHTGDVIHSGQPGIPDPSAAATDRYQSSAPANGASPLDPAPSPTSPGKGDL